MSNVLFKRYGFSDKQIAKVEAYYQKKKSLALENVSHLGKVLDEFIGYDFNSKEIIKIVTSFPGLFERYPEFIDDKISFYEKLGFELKDIRIIIFKIPQLLSLSDESIKHKLNFLEKLVMNHEGTLKMVVAFPNVLSLSIGNYEDKIEWMKRFDFSSDEISIIFRRTPQLFGLKLTNLEESLSCLKSFFDDTSIKRIVKEFPNVLCLKINTLFDKLEFLKESGLLEFIARRPSSLRQSKRLTEARMLFFARLGHSKETMNKDYLFTANYYFYCRYKIHRDELLKLLDEPIK